MLTLDSTTGLWTLFFSAFVSATIAPGGSEAVLLYLLLDRQLQPESLLLAATTGNTLGAVSTWWLGRLAAKGYAPQRLAGKHQARLLAHLQNWGSSLLLLSWLPVVGDALCFAAGWAGLRFWSCALAMMLGKFLRYGFVIMLAVLAMA